VRIFLKMDLNSFLKAIKYEFHGPDGRGDFDAISSVVWSQGFRTIDLFAGIGGIRLGFEAVGGHSVFSSEWEPEAQDTLRSEFWSPPGRGHNEDLSGGNSRP